MMNYYDIRITDQLKCFELIKLPFENFFGRNGNEKFQVLEFGCFD